MTEQELKNALNILNEYKQAKVKVSVLQQDLRAIDSIMSSIKTSSPNDPDDVHGGNGDSYDERLNTMIDKKQKLKEEIVQVSHFINHVDGILVVLQQTNANNSYVAFKKRYMDGKSTILISHEIPYSYEWVRQKSRSLLCQFAEMSCNVNRVVI